MDEGPAVDFPPSLYALVIHRDIHLIVLGDDGGGEG